MSVYINNSKNLVDIDKMLNNCLIKNNDGSYTLLKQPSGGDRFSKGFYIDLPAGIYKMSTIIVDGTKNVFLRAKYTDGTYSSNYRLYNNEITTVTFDKQVLFVQLFLSYNSVIGDYCTFKDFILTADNNVVYEPYNNFTKVKTYINDTNNLIPYPYSGIVDGEIKYGIIKCDIDKYGVITANYAGSGDTLGGECSIELCSMKVTTGERFFFSSYNPKVSSTSFRLSILQYDKDNKIVEYMHENVTHHCSIKEGIVRIRVVINFKKGAIVKNEIFKPVLYDDNLDNSVFEPYNNLVKVKPYIAEKNPLNLIPFPYAIKDGYRNGGITFNVLNDGTLILNGTASRELWIYIKRNYPVSPGEVYWFSSNNDQMARYKFEMVIVQDFPDGTTKGAHEYATNKCTILDGIDKIRIGFLIWKGAVLDNVVLKPMFCSGDSVLPYYVLSPVK